MEYSLKWEIPLNEEIVEGEGLAVEVGEFEVGAAGEDGFGDVRVGDLDAEVVVDGPESGVEEVVGGRD